MPISDREIDNAFAALSKTHGGTRKNYFGLVYLEQEFDLPRNVAANQVSFKGNEYGVDGFHVDTGKRNLYLYQFRQSASYNLFKTSLQKLVEGGIERVFSGGRLDSTADPMLRQLRSRLMENQAVIDRVCIHFVFAGDPAEAERSQALDKLREDLENKKYLIDQFFGREVTLIIEFRSGKTKKAGAFTHVTKTHSYPLELTDTISMLGPDNEVLTVGFVRIMELYAMFKEMGSRFFDRNIRGALPEDEVVNRSLTRAFRKIVLEGKDLPSVFPFNHNGVALSAEVLEKDDGHLRIVEPRILNGVQTLITLERFLNASSDHDAFRQGSRKLDGVKVLCKVVTKAQPEFVTTVTVNNNRQNPVEPWNLRANDRIQLELQDKFRNQLGIYYERQEHAFSGLSEDDLGGLGIKELRAIQLLPLAKTFLVADGDIDKLQRLRQVFDDDYQYAQVFSPGRLRIDSRHIMLCYKIQFRLRKLVNDIVEKGVNRYFYISRARNLVWALLCQGVLNDGDLEVRAQRFGSSLSLETNYTEWLSYLATNRCRFLIRDVLEQKPYQEKAAEGNYSFLRTNAFYEKCMDLARKNWKWEKTRLK
ncbi:MAG: hypothetical protein A2Y78_09135 [Acidobacteria bacterium RBG_13_68_16]|jgi:hypothetical protein|nr:MAG: hypothetical protein A2Y78_09135 [Acidobacteria bacterium RBG_13_68_16]